MALLFVGSLYGGLQVSQVVQTVKNTDDVNSVCNGFLHEILYHVVSVRTVSQNVLAAEQHLQGSLFRFVFDFAQSVPGILVKETQRSVECSASPALQGMVSYLIQLLYNGKHPLGTHTCGNQGLMCVAQYGFGNFYRSFF